MTRGPISFFSVDIFCGYLCVQRGGNEWLEGQSLISSGPFFSFPRVHITLSTTLQAQSVS